MNEESRQNAAVDRITEGGPDPGLPEGLELELELELERAAAAAAVALTAPLAPPARLQERLRRDADTFAAERRAQDDMLQFPRSEAPQSERHSVLNGTATDRASNRRWATWAVTGWLAAAASLTWAFWVRPPDGPVRRPSTLVERRATVLSSADVVAGSFKPGLEQFARLTGDVVWSSAQQAGYLRLRGLPANDPKREQYQLWIVDPERDAAFPVDGGVFDIVDGTGDSVVTVRAKLPIGRPTAFVITREKPGGVVKSQNPKPVAVASIAG